MLHIDKWVYYIYCTCIPEIMKSVHANAGLCFCVYIYINIIETQHRKMKFCGDHYIVYTNDAMCSLLLHGYKVKLNEVE